MNWLFLRGLAREQGHWQGFPAVFEEVVPGARVHYLDFPGVGTENHRESPINIAAIVDDVRARWLVAGEKPEGKWGVVSISMGGMVAMDWAHRFPEDWERVVIMNTSARNVGRIWHRLTPSGMKMLLRSISTEDLRAREGTIFEITTKMVEDRDALVNSWVQIATDRPVKRRVAFRQILAATRFSAPRSLEPPVLILGGEGDALVNVRCSRELARRLGAPFQGHPEAGHDLGTDAPNWAAEQIRDWIATE